MAITQNEFTGDSSRRRFAFTFPYIKEEDVKVSLRISNATADIAVIDPDNYTFPTATEIQLNAVDETTFQESTGAPKNAQDGNAAVTVRVFRETDIESAKAVFYPGSSVRAQDLNDNTLQALYAEQERENRAVDRIGGSVMQSDLTFQQADIVFQGQNIPPGDTNETTLTVAEPTADRTITLPNVTGTVVTTGDTDTVTSTMVDDSLVNANIAANAEIAVSKLADGAERQLLQTSADGDDVEWTSNVDIPGTLDVTGDATFDAAVTATTFTGNLTGDVTGDVTGDLDGNATTATDLAAATKVTSTEQVAHNVNDTTYYTTKAADERFWRQDSAGNEIVQSDATWTADNSRVATTGAIDARILNLVEEIGGFVALTNQLSFPATNPDINDDAGTIVSIGALTADLTFNSEGVATIANAALNTDDPPVRNLTVTITGGPASTTIEDDTGLLLVTTSTLHTYTWHRTSPDGTDVQTLANNMSDINDVADNIADINALEDVIQDIQTLADIENGDVAEDSISDLAAIASDVTTCATDIAAIRTVAADLNEDTSEIETVADSIANVDAVGGSINNVNDVADNINSINDFAERYTVSAGQPADPNDGDLWWDQSNDLLKAYDDTNDQWVAVTTESDTGLDTTGGTMTGVLVLDDGRSAGAPVLAFTGDSNTGIFSSAADSVDISANGATRLQVTGTAVKSTVPTEVEVTATGAGTEDDVITALTVEGQTDQTPAAGIGVGMDFAVETAADNVEIGAQVEAVTTNVTATEEDVDLVVNLMQDGNAAAEKFRIASDGDVTAQGNVEVAGGTVTTTNNTSLTLTGAGNGTVIITDDLAVNTGNITTTGNVGIDIDPAGDGTVTLGAATTVEGNLTLGTVGADLVFTGTNNADPAVERTITFQAPSNQANFVTYDVTWPHTVANASDVLKVSAVDSSSITLEWADVSRAPLLENELSTDGNVTIGAASGDNKERNAALVGPYTIKDGEEILINDGSKLVII